jgi:ParB-like chromosome segregation protein Spo0J
MAKKQLETKVKQPLNNQIKSVPIGELRNDPSNARNHSKNLDAIEASLVKFGQQKPIIAMTDGTIICGNGVFEVATNLGWEKLDVVYTNLKGNEAIAFAIADNRTSDLSKFDESILIEQLKGLRDDQEMLEATGFDETALARLFGESTMEIEMPNITYKIIVDCADEMTQRKMFDQFIAEGIKCQLLMS